MAHFGRELVGMSFDSINANVLVDLGDRVGEVCCARIPGHCSNRVV